MRKTKTGRTPTGKRSRAAAGGRRGKPSSLPVVALVGAALALVGISIRVATMHSTPPEAAKESTQAGVAQAPAQPVAPAPAARPQAAPSQAPQEVAQAPRPAPSTAAEPEPVEEAAPQPETATAWVRGRTETVHVKRVIDGDTFVTNDGRRVRLIGINTPEKTNNQPLNKEATALLKKLVDGQDVTLEYDRDEKDMYKRTLAYVHKGDVFVNGEIVRQGLAYAYTWKPNTAHKDDFVTWQREARGEHRGLWGLPAPKPCDYYVADKRGHRFHRPDCKRAKHIRPDRLLRFERREDAFDQGQNPCPDCNP